jgi:hypothetical protein
MNAQRLGPGRRHNRSPWSSPAGGRSKAAPSISSGRPLASNCGPSWRTSRSPVQQKIRTGSVIDCLSQVLSPTGAPRLQLTIPRTWNRSCASTLGQHFTPYLRGRRQDASRPGARGNVIRRVRVSPSGGHRECRNVVPLDDGFGTQATEIAWGLRQLCTVRGQGGRRSTVVPASDRPKFARQPPSTSPAWPWL